jgi:hypothetical protein
MHERHLQKLGRSFGRGTSVGLLVLVLSMSWIACTSGAARPEPTTTSVVEPTSMSVAEPSPTLAMGEVSPSASNAVLNLANLPLTFISNEGQAASTVRFQAKDKGGTISFTANGVVLERPSAGNGAPLAAKVVFEGVDPSAKWATAEPLSGTANFLFGRDPAKWLTGQPTYGAIVYEGIYPGIDLQYDGTSGQLQRTYTAASGADISRIRWHYEGASEVSRDEPSGDLLIKISNGTEAGQTLIERAPVAWQDLGGQRSAVPARYVLNSDKTVSVSVSSLDPSQPVTIDPTLIYSTFLGGGGVDEAEAIAVDPAGNVYLTGTTSSADFPTQNSLQTYGGGDDAFVVKIAAGGDHIIYSTYLGGAQAAGFSGRSGVDPNAWDGLGDENNNPWSGATNWEYGERNGWLWQHDTQVQIPNDGDAQNGATQGEAEASDDEGNGIAVDNAGNAYIVGTTDAADFPIQNGLQSKNQGTTEAFVAKLSPDGTALLYSTYLGGSQAEDGEGIAVDGQGNVYVTGVTFSANFPSRNALQSTNRGAGDAFLTKLATNLSGDSSLVYSTYLGGGSVDGGADVVVDAGGDAFLTGQTLSADFPTRGALQPANRGSNDAFVAKIDATGEGLAYSTYVGGSGEDYAYALAVDSSGSVYVTGNTKSLDFPVQNALYSTNQGVSDAFVAKLNDSGSAMVYCTYLGSSGYDYGYGIAVDGAHNAYVVGSTDASTFPTVQALQNYGGSIDAFLTKLSDNGSALLFSTYLGGRDADYGEGIALNSASRFVLGVTFSASFPTSDPVQDANQGGGDIFLAKISE